MPITREGKFLVTTTIGQHPSLGLESAILDDCVSEVIAKKYKAVFGNPSFGFKELNLDVLLAIPSINEIWFWDVNLKNIDAIYSLHSLQAFGIHDKRPAVDFSRLPDLKRIVQIYKPTDRGIESLQNMELLHVWRYAPKEKTFHNLVLPSKLTELQIMWANPNSLEGLSGIKNLRRLEIHRCRNLEDLSLLPSLFPNLEHLVVAACGRVSSSEGEKIAKGLPKLKHAFIQDRKVV